ncbi:MAG: hypothetical protein ACM31C_20305 [Acidobacteriota bacterium]
MGRIAVVALLGSLAGCDHLLQLDKIRPIGDASSIDAPLDGPELLCLSDNFDHASIDTTVWPHMYSNAPSIIADNGAQLVGTLGTTSTNAYAGVYTNAHDFAAMRTLVEVVQIPAGPGATAELAWRDPMSLDRIQMYVDGSMLWVGQTNGTGPDVIGKPYDRATMLYWQLRHDLGAGDVAFQTSADGQTWVTQRRLFPVISLASVAVELQAGTYTSVAAPGTAAFDNFAMIGACN